jgi:Zn-dependent peptidase ImmA (M78 family)
MKHLKSFKIFESNSNEYLNIDEFLDRINLKEEVKENIKEWERKEFPGLKILYKSIEPNRFDGVIGGGIVDPDKIFINSSRMLGDDFIKTFILIHETKHLIQHKKGIFMPKYFDTVVNNNFESFKEGYLELEKDANDYAFKILSEIGFEEFLNNNTHIKQMLRRNESTHAVDEVFKMMKSDIEKTGAKNFFELIKTQIGL